METLDKLKAKRKIIRTACTKLINKVYLLLESCDIESESDQEQLSEQLSSLEAKQLDLKSLNSEIEDLISDSALFDIEIQSSFEYEEQINEAKFKIKSKIKKFKTDQQPIPPLAANGSNILLGADFLCNVLRGEARKINKNLFLQPTLFGDTLIGQIPDLQKRKHSSVFTVSCAVVETDLKRLWELDSFLLDGTSENKSRDNLDDFGKELKIKNGRYEAPLQWKTNEIKEKLRNNFDVAEKRFIALEKKFNKDQALFERYNAVMQEQVNEGIIQMCHDECFTGYVMPHREVFRETSSSTKTRIVYDASSKQGNNISLNECLLSGENLNPNLIDVILKFREHKIGFCGDIARAFLQIEIAELDRNYLCFLYYKNCDRSQPVPMYHFNRHCFGVTCSPFVLAAAIKTHIKEYRDKYPLAYEMLNKSLYVDDLFCGSSTVQDALKLSSDAVSILKDAKMNMRKFDTNSKELKNLWRNSDSMIEINEQADSHLKVLGLVWNNIDDTLGLDLRSLLSNLNDNECTKRNVLHTAAKLFDPSGFISPFLIRIKCSYKNYGKLVLDGMKCFPDN
ncbi:uncharacterized protein LOC129959808 [Argiope bruennichi]|uniref:uncharacterized protein LOC129959808 n=1 Tax=Argiope bruennichi TaxID=94029 RepID=UPI002494DCA8|nr:uncharacterized protein LOC129959808 [Argiope bruennichi]